MGLLSKKVNICSDTVDSPYMTANNIWDSPYKATIISEYQQHKQQPS